MIPSNGASRLFWFITAVSRSTWAWALVAAACASSRSLIAVTPRERSSLARTSWVSARSSSACGGGEVGALDHVVDLREMLAGGDLVVGAGTGCP